MDTQVEQGEQSVKNTQKFPCRGCGGNMVFDPESNSLSCPYCGSKIEIAAEKRNIAEYDFSTAEDDKNGYWGSETRVIKCDSCGGETVLEVNNTAQFCAFCGSSHIVENDNLAGIAPESLIPFKIAIGQAKQLFTGWVKKRFFAPSAMKNNYQMNRFNGVYIPSWTYDSDTASTYTAEAGTYYYEQETRWVEENGKSVSKTVQVRKTRWWHTSGTYSRLFDDIPVSASKQIDTKLMAKLEPFNREELVGYRPEYLSGFLAERYSLGLKDGWELARRTIDQKLYSDIKNNINADEVRDLNIDTFYNDVKYKLTLLPIWISAFNYKNKAYAFMVNGQTGKVEGKYPLSVLKVSIAILLALGVVVGGIALYLKFKYKG